MNLLSIIGRVINRIIRSGNWYNNVIFRDCAKMWHYNTFNTEIANFGSTSGVNAFNYDGLPVKGANWAIGSNPISGDLALLKNYFSYLKSEGSIVIFPLCPFTSLAGSRLIDDDRYYTLLYASTIPYYSSSRNKKIADICANPLSIYPVVSIFSDIKHSIFKNKNKIPTRDALKIDAYNWMTGWAKEFSITDWDAPLLLINKDAIADCLSVIDEIISFCNARLIKPVFLTPPMSKQLLELYTPNIREKVLTPIEFHFSQKAVWYKNYLEDEEFIDDSSLFANSFLLNDKGAKLFTKKVLTDLDVIHEDRNINGSI